MLEALLELIGELLLQLLVEILAELGLRAFLAPLRRRPHPALAALGYGLCGTALGGISVVLLPHHFSPPQMRLVNLLAVPLLAGLCMVLVGKWRDRRGDERIGLDRFSYGALFAAAFAAMRFCFCH